MTRLAFSAVSFSLFVFAQSHALTEVYRNDDFQITGVTVSKSGRLFVNFPRWSDRYVNAVAEITKDGSVHPFPDETWNRWDGKPATAARQFVCVQSVVAEGNDLFIVDAAAPLLGPIVPNGPKLVRVDLGSNRVTRVYTIGAGVAHTDSYLNDVRIDPKTGTAYMTDSGHPGLIVVDLATGKAHRALDGHPSVQPENNVSISVNGKPVLGPDGKPPQFASDGIALSPAGDYLYYSPLTGRNVYRVRTAALRDNSGSAAASAVEKVASTFPTDGLWMDQQNRLYLSNINESAVSRILPGGKIETVLKDPRLEWPDTFSQGPDGAIYITASHINDSPRFNRGKSTRTKPYTVFRFNP